MGAIYAVIGLILLPFFLLASLIGSMAGGHDNPLGAIGGLIFGLFAPIFYGVLGFVFGAIGAFLYNFMAKWLGGIEVQVQPAGPPASIAYVATARKQRHSFAAKNRVTCHEPAPWIRLSLRSPSV